MKQATTIEIPQKVWSVLAFGLALIFIAPIFWMFISSFKTDENVFYSFLPSEFSLVNYRILLNNGLLPMGYFFVNTVIVALLSTAATLIVSTLSAYALCFIHNPLNRLIFASALFSILVPPIVTLIPRLFIYRELNLIDTLLPLIFSSIATCGFHIFLFKQHFMTFPKDLISAAQMDGASHLQILLHIILPSSKPVILTAIVIKLVICWNDFLEPLTYLYSPEKKTLSVGLASILGTFQTQWPILMAASTLSIFPVILLYLVFQKYYRPTIATSGINE